MRNRNVRFVEIVPQELTAREAKVSKAVNELYSGCGRLRLYRTADGQIDFELAILATLPHGCSAVIVPACPAVSYMQSPSIPVGAASAGHDRPSRDGERADQAADPRQLDLFIDGADAILVHEIVVGLMRRDGDRAAAGLRQLGQEHPHHPDLAALTVLVEALPTPLLATATHLTLTKHIEETERQLVPAARRLLGADADAFLRPMWQVLAATATDLTFAPTHPRAHRAWLCQQYGDWPQVLAAVENEPGWADTPLLRSWMGLARHHLGAPEVAIRLWLPLCWIDPALFAACAPTLPNPTIRAAWVAFEDAAPFEESLAPRALAPAWFPAWLVLRHPGLSRLFDADDIPDAGDAALVFRHLLALLPLEQHGLTDELVSQRRALRRLDESFFRYYMAVRGERRRSSS